MIKKIEILSTC